ncbi:MAG: DUF4292 domain-containing protein [Saprospiraceae bacterium]|nr:DUF4292 domain-containing protein [Saprospiraceae bacterium]
MKQTLRITSFLFIVLSILTVGCRLGKESLDATKERDAAYLQKKLIGQQVKADWFSAKIKAKHDSEDLSISFSGNLRMQKDSAIWMNIKKFGFEVARVLIQPDSIFVIDRFNNEFIAEDLQFVQRMVNFPANFSMIQSMLLGNPVFFTRTLTSSIENKQYKLSSSNGSTPKSTYWMDGRYQLVQMKFEEPSEKRWLDMSQSEFVMQDKSPFAQKRVLHMDSPDTGKMTVELEFSDIEWNVPKSMPFNKPDHY